MNRIPLSFLCTLLCLFIASCSNTTIYYNSPIQTEGNAQITTVTTQPISDDDIQTVNELLLEIERNPVSLDGKRIEVVGTVYKSRNAGSIMLVYWANEKAFPADVDSFNFWSYCKYAPHIDVYFENDDQLTYISSGDHVKINGIINTSNESYSIVDSKCYVITTHADRIK